MLTSTKIQVRPKTAKSKNYFSVEKDLWTYWNPIMPLSTSDTAVVVYAIEWRNSATHILCQDRYNLDKLQHNLKRIFSFGQLVYNWNDNNGEPLPLIVLNRAKKLLYKLEFQPEVFPTSRDSIQFEFSVGDDKYLELEIFDDHIIAFLQINDQEYEFRINEQDIPSLVNTFITYRRDSRWGEIIQSYKKDSKLVEF
jgi:hypothetical protein